MDLARVVYRMRRAFYGNKVLRHCPVGDEQIGGEGGADRMQKARSTSGLF